MDANFKPPTVGRIVHFYPGALDHSARQNNADFIPAMVLQVFESPENDMANLRIFPFGYETDILRGSVHHLSSKEVQASIPATVEAGVTAKPAMSYWVWPPIV